MSGRCRDGNEPFKQICKGVKSSHMQAVYLFKGLELAPAAVARVVELIPETSYDHKLDPKRFSFREALAHLADWERINLDRLKQGVENPGCTVQGFDEGQIAIDHDYASADPTQQARKFIEGRKDLLNYLMTIREKDWDNVYYHSERGRQTVFEQAVTILGHDMYHLEQFSQYLPS